jgi:hypothetical protein
VKRFGGKRRRAVSTGGQLIMVNYELSPAQSQYHKQPFFKAETIEFPVDSSWFFDLRCLSNMGQ